MDTFFFRRICTQNDKNNNEITIYTGKRKGKYIMKKSIRNLVLGAAMAIGVFGASTAALANTQYVQTDMNFRNGPSTSAAAIGSVPAGAQVDVISSQNGWDLINYKAQQTYSSTKDYFDYGFTQAAKNLPESGDGCHTVRVDGYLALRSAPSYDASNEIGRLYTGDIVQRTSSNTVGSYIEVYSPKYGAYGYVNAGFLS